MRYIFSSLTLSPVTHLVVVTVAALPRGLGVSQGQGLDRAVGGGEVRHAVREVQRGQHVRGRGDDRVEILLCWAAVLAPVPGEKA